MPLAAIGDLKAVVVEVQTETDSDAESQLSPCGVTTSNEDVEAPLGEADLSASSDVVTDLVPAEAAVDDEDGVAAAAVPAHWHRCHGRSGPSA